MPGIKYLACLICGLQVVQFQALEAHLIALAQRFMRFAHPVGLSIAAVVRGFAGTFAPLRAGLAGDPLRKMFGSFGAQPSIASAPPKRNIHAISPMMFGRLNIIGDRFITRKNPRRDCQKFSHVPYYPEREDSRYECPCCSAGQLHRSEGSFPL